jgi:hypothetical protein
MLGEIRKNATNRAFSSRNFNKTRLLFYNDYYRIKVIGLAINYTRIADFSKETRLHCHLGGVDTLHFSLDSGAAELAPAVMSFFGN